MCHQFWKDNNFQTLSFPPWIPNISPMGEISPRLRTPGLDVPIIRLVLSAAAVAAGWPEGSSQIKEGWQVNPL